MLKKFTLATLGIALFYFFLWFTTFEGYQQIRFRCYRLSLCYPLSQILEDRRLFRLSNWTSIFDPLYFLIPTEDPSLPTYELTVDKNDYQSIVDELPAPYSVQFKSQVVSKTSKIPGNLSIENQNYPIQVNFRGIGFIHWSDSKKSLRITFSQDAILSSQVDLIVPSESDYYGFFINKWVADYLGLYTVEPKIIRLRLNQDDFGPYILTDRWNKEFLESRGLQDGYIFGDIDPTLDRPPLYQSINAWKIYNVPSKSAEDFSAIERLLTALNNSDIQTSIAELEEIIDFNSFVKWEALSVFLNDRHQDDLHNIRLYLNPSSGKLEFMPIDFVPDLSEKNYIKDESLLDIDYNPLVTRLLKDPEIRAQRDRILLDLVNDQEFQESLWQRYDQLYRQTRRVFYHDPVKIESSLRYDWLVKRLKSQTQLNIKIIKQLLSK